MRKNRFLTGLLASSALVGPAAFNAALAADMAPTFKAPERAAVAPISGYLEMEAGFAWMRNDGTLRDRPENDFGYSGTDRTWVFNGAGRVNWWVGRNLSTQFDVWGGADSFGRGHDSGNNGVMVNFNLGDHLSYRVPEHYLVGIFGALGAVGSNANCCNGSPGITHGLLGLEGQWYLPNVTLYGQGGVQTSLSDVDNGGSYTAWFVRGVGRYFVDPNLRLEGSVFYAQGWSDNGYDFAPSFVALTSNAKFKMEQLAWTASVEKKLDGSPLALFARYEGSWTKFRTSFTDTGYGPAFDNHADGHTIENLFKVGFRLYLNEETLKYNDRMGTTLDIRDPFSSAYRAFGRTWNNTTPSGS